MPDPSTVNDAQADAINRAVAEAIADGVLKGAADLRIQIAAAGGLDMLLRAAAVLVLDLSNTINPRPRP